MSKQCPKCGMTYSDGDSFCPQCGVNLLFLNDAVTPSDSLNQNGKLIKKGKNKNPNKKKKPRWAKALIIALCVIAAPFVILIIVGIVEGITSGDATSAYKSGVSAADAGASSKQISRASSTSTVQAEGTNTYGNTASNIMNGGYAAIQGDWIYYHDNSNSLSKSKTDGTDTNILLKNVQPEFINVVGDWIYYVDETSSDAAPLYKIKTDGSKLTPLINKGKAPVYNSVSNVIVVGNWAYFKQEIITKSTNNLTPDKDDVRLYKMKTDGTGKTEIALGSTSCLNVVGNWIYFLNDSDTHIYKFPIGGGAATQASLVSSEGVVKFVVDGDWIYYISDPDNVIYKMKTDGSAKTKIYGETYGESTDHDLVEKYGSPMSDSLNVSQNFIYFRSEHIDYQNNDAKTLMLDRINTDGTGLETLAVAGLQHMNIVGNSKDVTMVGDLENLNIVGDWFYYFGRAETGSVLYVTLYRTKDFNTVEALN